MQARALAENFVQHEPKLDVGGFSQPQRGPKPTPTVRTRSEPKSARTKNERIKIPISARNNVVVQI